MMNNRKLFVLRTWLRARVLDVLGGFSTPQPGIHILNGHRIEKSGDADAFRKMLTELSKTVTFIRIEDAVRMIIERQCPSKPLVAFTFDDGFMDDYDVFAPILEEFGTNGLFFINPNYVEGNEEYIQNFDDNIVMTPDKRPMRWNHICELSKRGHIIGAHTMDHYMVNTDNKQILEYQINTCKELIENHTGVPCDYFAFPYGKLTQANDLSISIACQKYKYVFSQSDYKHYYSFGGKVINRRHFEPFWSIAHVKYFLSCKKTY